MPVCVGSRNRLGHQHGEYHRLVQELRLDDVLFQQYFRLDTTQFGELLRRYKIAVSQKEMQSFDRPSNHHAEARSPGQPTPHSPPETLSIRGRDIIAAFIQ
ncbi:hypothetical protein QQF64_029574 [Cirrhinus molitorella]|uniref:Uncharacterized protein n=1 Tax=Cirrhinus molitorella TaxID=172907 RepID=A0ABR3N0X7_9TELE